MAIERPEGIEKISVDREVLPAGLEDGWPLFKNGPRAVLRVEYDAEKLTLEQVARLLVAMSERR